MNRLSFLFFKNQKLYAMKLYIHSKLISTCRSQCHVIILVRYQKSHSFGGLFIRLNIFNIVLLIIKSFIDSIENETNNKLNIKIL